MPQQSLGRIDQAVINVTPIQRYSGSGATNQSAAGGYGKLNANNFSSFAQAVANEDQRVNGQWSSALQAFGSLPQQEEQQPERREANLFEQVAHKLENIGQEVMRPVNEFVEDSIEKKDIVGTVVGIMANTAASNAAGLFEVPSKLGAAAIGGTDMNSYNEEDDTVSNKQLNWNQRMGAGASALIDVAGSGFGGVPDTVRAAKNAFTGAEGAAKAAKAVNRFENVAKNLPDPAKTVIGYGTKAAWNAFEEGAEEAVQSFADSAYAGETGQQVVDNALQSAAMGAIGGGAWGLVGHGINRHTMKKNLRQEQQAQNAVEGSPGQGQDYFAASWTPSEIGAADAEVAKHQKETVQRQKEADMSASITGVPATRDINPNNIGYPVEPFRRQWDRSPDNRQYILNWVNQGAQQYDEASLDQIFRSDNSTLANSLNSIAQTAGYPYAVYERSPHTNLAAMVRAQVQQFTTGNGLLMNPISPEPFGGDLDGDNWTVTFDPQIVSNARPLTSYMFRNRPQTYDVTVGTGDEARTETREFRYGQLDFDPKWSNISFSEKTVSSDEKTPVAKASFEHVRDANVAGIQDQNVATRAKRIIDDAWRDYRDALSGRRVGGKTYRTSVISDPELSPSDWKTPQEALAVIYDMRSKLNDLSGTDRFFGDTVAADLLWNLQYDTQVQLAIDSYVDKGHTAIERGNNIASILPMSERQIEYVKGSIDTKSSHWIEILDLAHVAARQFTTKNAMLFRANGSATYVATAVRAVDDLRQIFPENTALTEQYAFFIRLMDVGSEPVDNALQLFKGYVMDDTVRRTHLLSRKIGDGSLTVDQFMSAFTQVYNEHAKEFERAAVKQGFKGLFRDMSAKGLNAIDPDVPGSAERAFADLFGSAPMSSLFPVKDGSAFYSVSLDGFLDTVCDSPNTILSMELIDQDPETSAFIDRLIRNHESRNAARGKAAENLIVANLKGRAMRFDESGDHRAMDASETPDRLLWTAKWQVMENLIGHDAAIYFGLRNIDEAIASPWGEQLFSGDVDQIDSAIVAISKAYKYREYIAKVAPGVATVGGDDRADAVKMYAKLAAINAQVSRLDDYIIQGICQGDDWLLRMMIDPRVPYVTKEQVYETLQNARGTHISKSNMMFDALRTKDSELGDGEIGERLRSARQKARTMDQLGRFSGKVTADEIERMYSSGGAGLTRETVGAAINRVVRDNYKAGKTRAYSSLLYNCLDLQKSGSEKGVAIDSATMAYQAYSTQTDGLMLQLIERLTGTQTGAVSPETLQQNVESIKRLLVDKDYHLNVNTLQGERRIGRSEVWKILVGETVSDTADPTADQWVSLIRQYPSMGTVLAPSYLTPVVGNEVSVVEMAGKPLVDAIADEIKTHATPERIYDKKIERITDMITNDTRAVRAVLGNMRAEAGVGWESLKDSPAAWQKAVEKSVNRIARYLLNENSADQLMRVKDGEGARRAIIAETAERVTGILNNAADRVARNMPARARDISPRNDALQNEILQRQARNALVARLRRIDPQTVVTSGLDDNDTLFNQTNANVAQDIRDMYEAATKPILDAQSLVNYIVSGMPSSYRTMLNNLLVTDKMRETWVTQRTNGSGDPQAIAQAEAEFDNARDEILSESASDIMERYAKYAIPMNMCQPDPELGQVDPGPIVDAVKQARESGLFGVEEEGWASKEDIEDACRRDDYFYLWSLQGKQNSLVMDEVVRYAQRNIYGKPEGEGLMANNTDAAIGLLQLQSEIAGDETLRPDMRDSTVNPPHVLVDAETERLAENVITNMQSAGNTVNAGLEGGEYKEFAGIAALNDEVDCGAPAEPITPRSLYQQIMNGTSAQKTALLGATYEVRDDDGQWQKRYNLGEGSFQEFHLLTLDKIDAEDIMRVYRLGDCAFGCSNHTRHPVTGTHGERGRYWYMKDVFALMGFYNSEAGTFKLKKTLAACQHIYEKISTSYDLASYPYSVEPDPARRAPAMWAQINEVRANLAKHYERGFAERKLDGFGAYDAKVISMFTTPIVEVQIGTDTQIVSVSDIQKLAKGVPSPASEIIMNIDSWRVVPMSVNQVCRHVDDRILRDCQNDVSGVGQKALAEAAVKGLTDWSDYRVLTDDDVRGLFRGMRPLPTQLSEGDYPIAATPLAMARIIEDRYGLNRGMASETHDRNYSNLPTASAEHRADAVAATDAIDGAASGYQLPFCIGYSNYRQLDQRAVLAHGETLTPTLASLPSNVTHWVTVSGRTPAYLVRPMSIDQRPVDELTRVWNQIRGTGVVALVPQNLAREAEQVFPRSCFVDSSAFAISGQPYLVVDPHNEVQQGATHRSKSQVGALNPSNVMIFVADKTGADGDFRLRPGSIEHLREPIDGIANRKFEDQFPGISPRIVEVVPKAELKDVSAALDAKGPQFVYPQWQGNYRLSADREMEKANIRALTEQFLDAAKSDAVDENGNLVSGLAPQKCLCILKVEHEGVTKYSPLIMSNGGMGSTLASFHVGYNDLDVNNIKVAYTASMGIDENNSVKMIWEGDPVKSMARVVDESDFKYVELADDSQLSYLDMPDGEIKIARTEGKANIASVQSRFADKEILRRLRNYTLAMNTYTDWGYYFKRDDNGVWRFDREWFDNFCSRNNLTAEEMFEARSAFLDPNLSQSKVWDKIFYGGWSLDENLAHNSILTAVGKAAYEIGIPPMKVYSNIEPKLGELAMKGSDGDLAYARLSIDADYVRAIQEALGSNWEDMRTFFRLVTRNCSTDIPFCSDAETSSDPRYERTIMSEKGNLYFKGTDQGRHEYFTVLADKTFWKKIGTQLGLPSPAGLQSNQHDTNFAMQEDGYRDWQVKDVVDTLSVTRRQLAPYAKGQRSAFMRVPDADLVTDSLINSYTKRADLNDLMALSNTYQRANREYQESFLSPYKMIESTLDDSEVKANDKRLKDVLERVNSNLGIKASQKMQRNILDTLIKHDRAWTSNAGSGVQTITYENWRHSAEHMVERIQNRQFPISGGFDANGNFGMAVLPDMLMDYLWEASPAVRSSFNTREKWYAARDVEVQKVRESIPLAKRNTEFSALRRMYMGAELMNGNEVATGALYGEWSIFHYARALEKGKALVDSATGEQLNHFKVSINDMSEMFKDMRTRDMERRKRNLPDNTAPNGYTGYWYGTSHRGLELMKSLSQLMSLSNPLLGASAIARRGLYGGFTNFMLAAARKGVPFFRKPYVTLSDRRRLNAICQDDRLRDFVQYYSEARRIGVSPDQILQAQNAGDLQELILAQYRKMNLSHPVLRKYSRNVFRIASGGKFFASKKVKTYFDRLASLLDPDDPADALYLHKPTGSDMTIFEQRVYNDPYGFMVETLMKETDNPLWRKAQMAMSLAEEIDQAQDTAINSIMRALFENHSVADFFMSTGFCKFPYYAMNVSGWMLNHVLPMSAINYKFTEWVGSREDGGRIYSALDRSIDLKRMHLENKQQFASFSEALMHDAMTLSTRGLALVILALLNLEPPKKEEKMGNLSEWTILGQPIAEEWWINDIAGPAFALAASIKSAMIGKPRFDLVVNWYADAMYNNPMIQAGGIVADLFMDDETLLDDLIDEAELYSGAETGEPSVARLLQMKSTTGILNWASQFFTPSFVKEAAWVLDPDNKEASYKNVYVTDAYGNRVQDQYGNWRVERTNPMDQAFRKVTRNNPFLGVIMNIFTAGDEGRTGYLEAQMPDTVMYNEEQVLVANALSVVTYDEDGQPIMKDQADRRAISTAIMNVLASSDDPAQLRADGFCLNYDTRNYVSKVIWDQINFLDKQWSGFLQETGRNYYLIGDGDRYAGEAKFEALEQAYYDNRNYYKDLYYKLWDDAISSGPERYNRYKTTYETDDEGNVYATGLQRSLIYPFKSRPDNEEYTMGYEGDWETRSPLTGRSAGGRALIPITEQIETPDIESWKVTDQGYSDAWEDTVGELAGNEWPDGLYDGDSLGASEYRPYGYRSYGYGRRSYYRSYGGRGYSRSYSSYRRGGGGGGGGGYSPNLYSRLPNISPDRPNVMYSERLYDPNYNYLRPNFETKGSREAYKRSDI